MFSSSRRSAICTSSWRVPPEADLETERLAGRDNGLPAFSRPALERQTHRRHRLGLRRRRSRRAMRHSRSRRGYDRAEARNGPTAGHARKRYRERLRGFSQTATQPDMPESAIASGCVDFVLSPEDIALEISRIAKAQPRDALDAARNLEYARPRLTPRGYYQLAFLHLQNCIRQRRRPAGKGAPRSPGRTAERCPSKGNHLREHRRHDVQPRYKRLAIPRSTIRAECAPPPAALSAGRRKSNHSVSNRARVERSLAGVRRHDGHARRIARRENSAARCAITST
jgi:hypothetical protein